MGSNLTDAGGWFPEPLLLLAGTVLGIAAVAAALLARHRIAAGDPAGARVLATRPEDVAVLNGGPVLAVYAALSAMHVDGTVATSGRTTGQVLAGGPLTRSATPLQRAIHRAAHRLTPIRSLPTHEPVRSELVRTVRRLETAGLLLSPAEDRRYRATAWLPGAVVAGGVVVLGVGLAAGRPPGLLAAHVGVLALVTVVFAARAPRRTRAGDAALAAVRAAHGALAPAMRPDWRTVGPAAAAMSVAAFGVGAMLAGEPEFADDVGARKVAALGGTTPGGGATDGAGAGGGDGGGSGGGGDGGGSGC